MKLRKNKFTDWFFRGYEPIRASQVMVWNRKAAWKAAGFDKLAKENEKKKKPKHERTKKRTMLGHQEPDKEEI